MKSLLLMSCLVFVPARCSFMKCEMTMTPARPRYNERVVFTCVETCSDDHAAIGFAIRKGYNFELLEKRIPHENYYGPYQNKFNYTVRYLSLTRWEMTMTIPRFDDVFFYADMYACWCYFDQKNNVHEYRVNLEAPEGWVRATTPMPNDY